MLRFVRARIARSTLPAVAAALIAAGCGQEEGYRFTVHPTSGKVTRGGQPVNHAFVRFHPVDPKTVEIPKGQTGPTVMLTSETDADGRYVMSTYLDGDGVPAGEYRVSVLLPGANAPAAEPDLEASGTDLKDNAPPAAGSAPANAGPYADPATSKLTASIKSGDNVVDFPLN